MAGVVYKQLVSRCDERDKHIVALQTRIATLENEAREAVKAKDQEIAEWRRLAMAQASGQRT
jgi:cell division protein FtsL